MAKTKKARKKSNNKDSVYFLKVLLYLVVGAQWVWVVNSEGSTKVPIPFGLIVGILLASRDHFQMDRKIEFAVLIVAMFLGYVVQSGIFITA